MKNLFFLLFGFALLLAVACTPEQPATDPPSDQVSYIQTTDLQQAAATIELDAPVILVQDSGEDPPTVSEKSFVDLLKENWLGVLLGLLGFIEIIVRLTPTKKDDSLLNKLYKILDFLIPNFRQGGGRFTPPQEE
ncbi:hypothetical protein [uncultured Sunxiuqinia sp.]|uniref:hypothetical protein n=1 Tax=uncultured Sunxiuqinia sp. TaxID=1573825 RepID=UPI002623318E|nr:hypothetical protein [uncultured Sunxiuqinia sp.]